MLSAKDGKGQKGRRGIQPILLSHWSQKSCDNFLEICKSAEAPAQVEIGLAPYVKDTRKYPIPQNGEVIQTGYALPNLPGSTGAYAQFETLRYVTDQLLRAGKSPAITVHLAFHAKQSDPNSAELRERVADFYIRFFKDYQNLVPIALSPSLEDEYANEDDFKAYANVVTKKMADLGALRLDGGNVVTNTWLRRSPSGRGVKAPYVLIIESPFKKPNGTVIKRWKIKVRSTEVHGPLEYKENNKTKKLLDLSNITAYSNDGNFVWFDNPRGVDWLAVETADSADNANLNDPNKYGLADFIGKTYRSGKTVLLWCPAYNLFEWSRSEKKFKKRV